MQRRPAHLELWPLSAECPKEKAVRPLQTTKAEADWGSEQGGRLGMEQTGNVCGCTLGRKLAGSLARRGCLGMSHT